MIAPLWGVALGLAAAVYDPLTRAEHSKGVALGVVALALAASRLPHWWKKTAGSPPVMLLVGWLAASLAWSAHPAPLSLLPWTIAALLALSVPAEAAPRLAAYAAAAMVGTQSLLQLAGVPAAGAGNGNWLGLPLTMALPALIERLPPERPWRSGWLGAVVAAAALLVVSGSRAAWVGLAIAVALMLPRRHRVMGAVAITAVAIAVALQPQAIAEALRGRAHIWQISVEATSLFGAGAGDFGWAFREAQGSLLRTLPVAEAARRFAPAQTAHHDLLHVAVEGGLVGAGLLLAALGHAFFALRRQRAAATAVLAVAIAGLADVPLHLPAGALFFGLLLARADAPLVAPAPRLAPLAAVALGALLMPGAATRWWVQRELTRWQQIPLAAPESLEALTTLSNEGELHLALAVARLDRGQLDRAAPSLDVAEATLPDLSVMLARGRWALMRNDLERADRAFRAALYRHPGLVRGWLGRAETARRRRAFDEAEAALDRLHLLRPHDPRVRELAERIRRDRIDAESGVDQPRDER